MPLHQRIPKPTHSDEHSMTMKPYLTDNNNVIPSRHSHRQPSSLLDNAKRPNASHSQDDDEDDEDNALHLFQQRIKRGRCDSPQYRNSNKDKKKRSWLSSDDDADDDDDNYGKQLGDQSFSSKKQPQQPLSSPGSPTEKRKRGRPRKDSGADESYSTSRRFSSSIETATRDHQSNGHNKLTRKCKSTPKQRSHQQTGLSSSPPPGRRTTNKTPVIDTKMSDIETSANHTSTNRSPHAEDPPLTPSSPSTKSRPSSLTDPNRADKAGRTKLFTFTSSGHLDKVKELVCQGANVNFRDHAGWVPLHEAALKGQCDIASYFIACGADVNVRGYGDDTPLHDACSSGHADIVQLLIDSGADVFALNSDKQQPIDVCDNEACERIIQAKMKQLDRLVARDSTGRTTLHRMCAEGRFADVASLVKQGANVNAEDSKRWTPLHEAVKHGHLEIVRLLVQHGADINHSGYQGTTVLHSACRSGHDDIVHFLMDQGANIHATTDAGKSVYEVTTSASIRRDLAATIDDERKQRATSDAIDEITFTALRQRKLSSKSSASSSRNTPLSREERKIQAIMKSFEALEQQQPRQHHSSRSSRASRRRDVTPTSDTLATKKERDDADNDHSQNDADEMIDKDEQLVSNVSDSAERRKKRTRQSRKSSVTRTPTRSPSRERLEDTLDSTESTNKESLPSSSPPPKKKLDPTKLNPHKKDTSGRTHLHRWAIRGDVNVVKVLLQAGADPNVTDHAGYTPLHESSLRDKADVVRLLLENGANVDAKGVELDTALHDAVDNGHPRVVDILLQFGADPHIRNSKGMTPLEMAKENDLFEIQSLLKQAITNGKKKIKKDQGLASATQVDSPEEKHQVKKQTKKRRLVLAADLEQASSPSSSSSSTAPTRQRSPTLDFVNIKTEPSSRVVNPMDIHMLTEEKPPSSQSAVSSPSYSMKSRKKERAAPPLSPIDGPHTPIPTPYVERWLAKRVKEEIKVMDKEPFTSCAVTSSTSTSTATSKDIDTMRNTKSLDPVAKTIKTDTEMTTPPPSSPLRPRTLSEAMRYLPLYTVQLVEEDGIQSSLYVLDLQIGLLLNLSTDALWYRYPNLRRRQVTLKEKERLWSPLASMVCAGAGAQVPLNSMETSTHDNSNDDSDSKTRTMRFRDQEKQRFLDMDLYFVHLDPVVSLIKHDYDYLSKNLITITLDIGYQQDQPPAHHVTPATPPPLIHTSGTMMTPRHSYNHDASSTHISKTPLKKRLPPKFAMKMQRQAIRNNSNSAPTSPR